MDESFSTEEIEEVQNLQEKQLAGYLDEKKDFHKMKDRSRYTFLHRIKEGQAGNAEDLRESDLADEITRRMTEEGHEPPKLQWILDTVSPKEINEITKCATRGYLKEVIMRKAAEFYNYFQQEIKDAIRNGLEKLEIDHLALSTDAYIEATCDDFSITSIKKSHKPFFKRLDPFYCFRRERTTIKVPNQESFPERIKRNMDYITELVKVLMQDLETSRNFKLIEIFPKDYLGHINNTYLRKLKYFYQNKQLEVKSFANKIVLTRLTFCKSCCEKERQIVFQPCRHFVLCKDCASRILVCSECGEAVADKLEILFK